MRTLITILTVVIASTTCYQQAEIVSARIESCRGCSLNRLPEVKQFVMQDAAQYERLEVRFITGAQPELVLLGAEDQELERLDLSHLNRKQCNELLEDKGFLKKPKNSEF